MFDAYFEWIPCTHGFAAESSTNTNEIHNQQQKAKESKTIFGLQFDLLYYYKYIFSQRISKLKGRAELDEYLIN